MSALIWKQSTRLPNGAYATDMQKEMAEAPLYTGSEYEGRHGWAWWLVTAIVGVPLMACLINGWLS